MTNDPQRLEWLKIYDQEQRIDLAFPDIQRQVTPYIIRYIDHNSDDGSFVMYSLLTEENADAIIREQIAYFDRIGKSFEWKVFSHDRPADLKERLVKLGFEAEEDEAIMMLDFEADTRLLERAVPPEIRRITEVKDIDRMMALEKAVWDEDFSSLGGELVNTITQYPDLLSLYVAEVDGLVVSASWTRYQAGCRFASLWGGSTLPDYRRQGFYTALLCARAQEAHARGIRFLTVDASPMSRPILEKHGFRQISTATACNWSASKSENGGIRG